VTVVGAAGAPDCSAATASARGALATLAANAGTASGPWAGPLRSLVGGEPPPSPCGVAAVVLPAGAKFVGYRYEAADARGSADCVGDQECGIGEARWLGHPNLERGAGQTIVWSVIENRATEGVRQGRLTVYFRPPPGWIPPVR
jgi:hypothetical protein